jgi:hypothetical protein
MACRRSGVHGARTGVRCLADVAGIRAALRTRRRAGIARTRRAFVADSGAVSADSRAVSTDSGTVRARTRSACAATAVE